MNFSRFVLQFVYVALCIAGVLLLIAALSPLPEDDAQAVLADSSAPTATARPAPTPVPTFTPAAAPAPLQTPVRAPAPAITPSHSDPQAIFHAGNPALNSAKDEALGVIAQNLMMRQGLMTHSAGPGYDAPWIRDSYAWGMIPSDVYPQLAPYTTSELRYWLNQQTPAGQWVSHPQSGFYDETAILISAALDAYRVTGDRRLLIEHLPRLRRGWTWLKGNTGGRNSTYLLWTPVQSPPAIDRRLPVSVDWADQIARRNYSGQVNLLWYRATQSMAIIEQTLGNAQEAERYFDYAARIKDEFNGLFWTNGAIYVRNAPPTTPFGHYRSWFPHARDYFELDTNLQAIVYGMADEAQAQSILKFVQANQTYLLGSETGAPPPAKTLYGDYDPGDYAMIRNKMSDGIYHNAYWMPIGALSARAFHRAGNAPMVQRIMASLAGAFKAGQPVASAAEWYHATGRVGGVPAYQWSARLYLDALFRAYLGVEPDWSSRRAESLVVKPLFGGVSGRIKHLGKHIVIRSHGSGAYRYAIVNERVKVEGHVIAEALLTDGTVIDLYLE